MRKSIFFAAAFAGVLCSCSQDEAIEGGMASGAQEGLVPIEIGLAQVRADVTRGTGTVGGLDTENSWAGQSFNVYMFDQGTINVADDVEGVQIYNNQKFNAPATGEEGLATAADNSVKYYPSNGEFDFVGYHTNGAEGSNTPQANAAGDGLELDITIDGSQDVMVADALLDEAGQGGLGDVPYNRTYSAFSARHGVTPTLTFKHQLSRLQFTIIGGNEGSCSHVENGTEMGVRVTSIKVKSKNTGTLTIAKVGSDSRTGAGAIAWDDTEADLTLMQRAAGDADGNEDLVAMTEVLPTWNDETSVGNEVAAGEALLVAPDNQYELTVTLVQNVVTENDPDGGVPTVEEKTIEITENIQLSGGEDSSFEPGHSYNVKLTVYGLERIDINAALTKWEEGEEIELNPMDYPNEPYAGE